MDKVMGSKKDYEKLVTTMNNLSEDDFPIFLSRDDPMDVSMADIKEFLKNFQNDTNLDAYIQLNTCSICDKLHMMLAIDVKEEPSYGNLHLLQ